MLLIYLTHVGVFLCQASEPDLQPNFPTHAGVFPGVARCTWRESGYPHTHGGVSERFTGLLDQHLIFLTPVGVFLSMTTRMRMVVDFPHEMGVFPEVRAKPAH